MSQQNLLQKVAQYYTGKINEHGATHRGVDWNSQESQEVRFEQLLKITEGDAQASVLDYGCGYGAMARYMQAHGFAGRYYGFDIAPTMIEAAQQQNDLPNCVFSSDAGMLPTVDYTIASGIFSVKLGHNNEEWQEYILTTLETLAKTSSKGFSFNMLTGYSDPEKMRPDLFYGDVCFFLDHCIRKYSRHVALLHNYGLYEFTVLVRHP